MNALKAQKPDSYSDAIVVSFDGRWLDALKTSAVSLVFRKRGPRALTPRWIYVYVGSPHSLMIGRFAVRGYEQLAADAAMKRALQAGLSTGELAEYLSGYKSVAAFSVEPFQSAPCPRSFAQLKKAYSFSPPQSFLVLSKDGKRLLDATLGFAARDSGRNS